MVACLALLVTFAAEVSMRVVACLALLVMFAAEVSVALKGACACWDFNDQYYANQHDCREGPIVAGVCALRVVARSTGTQSLDSCGIPGARDGYGPVL